MTSDDHATSKARAPDLRRPSPPEARRNIATLLEDALASAERSVFDSLDARGFGDIRPAHSKVFSVIAGTGSRITDMAAAAAMTKQSMQYLVDDLERLGYAERVGGQSDRRAKLIRLTPRGRAAVLVARDAIATAENAWTGLLGAEKVRRLRALLEELADAFAKTRASGG
ncbi:MAG: winged helix-turn-helix transcriptional regulator [Bauldia sp.]|nr:winged helix-turn-helix transcriptional regulator [Bauldia sp.]